MKISESNWEYSEVLRDSLTALAWGYDIEDFWKLSFRKRALMIETVVVRSQMRAYEEELSRSQIEREQARSRLK